MKSYPTKFKSILLKIVQMRTLQKLQNSIQTQEPITWSVQLPYSVCETAFSQVGLFLDQPFPLQIRSFHFFWILLNVSLTIAKAREKLTKRGFNRKNSHTE